MNKKRYSAILVMSLILTTGIAMAATMPTQGNVNNGKEVFNEKCGICHATGTAFPLSNLSKLAATDIISTVRNGVNDTTMRSFNVSELNDTALNDVVAYIQSASPVSMSTTTANVSTTTNVSQPTQTATEIATEAPTEVLPTEVPTEVVTEIQTPVPTPTPKSPGFEVVIGIIGIVSIYLLRHKNKR